jgi:DNA-binding transcriptional LysR family regulator
MQQIARNVTMEGCGALRDCRYLLHDRDTKYSQSFRAIIASGRVEPLVLRHASKAKADVVIRLTPRLLSDDMIGLKQAAIAGLGIVAPPGYVCREDVRSGALRRVLPAWLAGDSTITALIPYRQGLLPSIRVFIDHLAAEFPKAVAM